MLLIKGNAQYFQIRSMDFDFLQTSHLFSVLSLKQSSRLRFRIATRGACRKRCSSKFCKIHMKAPVSELFFNKRETPTKMLSWEFCEISKTLFDQMFRTAILWNTCEILLFFIYKNIYLSRT